MSAVKNVQTIFDVYLNDKSKRVKSFFHYTVQVRAYTKSLKVTYFRYSAYSLKVFLGHKILFEHTFCNSLSTNKFLFIKKDIVLSKHSFNFERLHMFCFSFDKSMNCGR